MGDVRVADVAHRPQNAAWFDHSHIYQGYLDAFDDISSQWLCPTLPAAPTQAKSALEHS